MKPKHWRHFVATSALIRRLILVDDTSAPKDAERLAVSRSSTPAMLRDRGVAKAETPVSRLVLSAFTLNDRDVQQPRKMPSSPSRKI